MKKLDRLKKENVRSMEPKASPAALSLENLRQVTGGTNAYVHVGGGGSTCEPVRTN